ncbi:zinc-binding protein A33-like isoform X2 [Polypterus senegalus]|nr:zinc-binding protein A33-like isoform X2 [Polypterus senegalus]
MESKNVKDSGKHYSLEKANLFQPSSTEKHHGHKIPKKPRKGDLQTALISVLSDQQFTCPICLDIFIQPVSITCGHNFCMACILKSWDANDVYTCPLCKKVYPDRPDLHINRDLAEITEEFSWMKVQDDEESNSAYHGVPCDACTGRKRRAVKSCLTCPASYCEEHIKAHYAAVTLKTHLLVDPLDSLEERLCEEHLQALELFCRTDQTCICLLCSVTDHKNHNIVEAEVEWSKRKKQFLSTKAKIESTINERQGQKETLKTQLKLIENSIQEEREASEKVLNELICAIERTRAEIYRSAETKWKLIENQTECLLNLIEQEITELKSKSVQFEKILETDDPIHSLQVYQSACKISLSHEKCDLPDGSDFLLGVVNTMFYDLAEYITSVINMKIQSDLTQMRRYAADVTLDPDTASPWLILSEDGKAVRYANERQHLPDSPLRFDPVISVLGLKSFHSGKHYWEVDTGDKTDWDLGVAKESVRRKGMLMLSPQNGYWTLCLREGSHVRACGNPTVNLSMNTKPRKVGIFLDYDGGFLSFYDVSSRGHLYTFFDTFTEKLYPYFNPFITYEDKNDHPLKICSFSVK